MKMRLCITTILVAYLTVLQVQDTICAYYRSNYKLKVKVWQTCCNRVIAQLNRCKRSDPYLTHGTKRADRSLGVQLSNAGDMKSNDLDDHNTKNRDIPSINDTDAKSFIARRNLFPNVKNLGPTLGLAFYLSGLTEECCSEGCDYEEVLEGSDSYYAHHLLKEECWDEGCSNEEVREHCD